jgi:hypothetical protein
MKGLSRGPERHHKPVRLLAFPLGTVAGLWLWQGECGATGGSLAIYVVNGGSMRAEGATQASALMEAWHF